MMDDQDDYCATENTCPDQWPDGILRPPDDMEPVYATLHFYYDNPESMRRFRACNQAEDVRSAIREYDNELRRRWKYGDRGVQMMTVEQARGLLWASLKRYGVNLDDD